MYPSPPRRCLLDEIEIKGEVQRPHMTMTTLIPMPNGVGRTGSGDPPSRSDSSQAAT